MKSIYPIFNSSLKSSKKPEVTEKLANQSDNKQNNSNLLFSLLPDQVHSQKENTGFFYKDKVSEQVKQGENRDIDEQKRIIDCYQNQLKSAIAENEKLREEAGELIDKNNKLKNEVLDRDIAIIELVSQAEQIKGRLRGCNREEAKEEDEENNEQDIEL